MKNLNLCFLFLSLILLISCNKKGSEISNSVSLNCEKLTSREDAQNLMKEINDKRLTDSISIVENLIGEWGLIGIVPGWFGFETGQECFKLTIDRDQIKLEDLNTGTISTSDWNLKVFRVNVYTGFYLETNEDVWTNRMGMEVFGNKEMFGSGRVDDGNIYIYEKLE